MTFRPIPLFLIALGLVGLATVLGLTVYADASVEAERDRITAEAVRLAADAVAWSRTPAVLGGGRGTPALTAFRAEAVGRTVQDGVVQGADATFRLLALDTTAPVVEGRDGDGQPVVRVAVLGPAEPCLVATAPGDPTPERPEGCPGW